MLVSEFLTATNYALRGTDDDSPTFGDTDSDYWVATLNRKIFELYSNTKVLWDTTFESTPNEKGTVATAASTTLTGTGTRFTDYRVGDKLTVEGETVRTIATITSDTSLTVTVAFSNTDSGLTFTRSTIIATGVETYNLNRYFIAPANQAYVLTTDDDYVYLDYIRPKEDDAINRKVFISGMNPASLTFNTEVESTESIVGGTLYVPGYYMPPELTAATEDIPLPDPYWGVMAVAAELAATDISFEDREANLNAKANALYSQMVRNNRRGTYGHPKKSPTSVYKIRNAEVR